MWPLTVEDITLLSNYIMISFQRMRLLLEIFDNVELLVKEFTIHNLSAPNKRGILDLKDNRFHVIPSSTK